MEQPDMIKSNNESKGEIWGCCWREEEDSLVRAMLAAILECQEHPVGGGQSRNRGSGCCISLPVLGPAVLSNCSSTLSRPQKEVPCQAAGIQQHGGRL